MNETVRGTTRVFDGRLLKVDRLDVELPGGKSGVREIIRHPGAAVVLAQLDDGRFVLVRQYRAAIGRITLEVVAGTLQPGEAPETCAHRELREESGYSARRLVKLGEVLPAPGYTTERLHTYYARLEPQQRPLATDEDETVQVVYATEDEIEAQIADGSIQDAKTLAAWLLYRRRHIEKS